ncbi:MAG: formyltransferase family protein [Candidatus Uhrbacteria bacterium]|nr:formyltransferase family protein [Candidatus Uhrbacteria bacterium]MDP3793283.1 formyltransferase family protein [Candidatus Uhrbacteria bacterium]
MKKPIRLALFISGGGTTMEQIILACQSGSLKGKIEPALVIASRANAGGIKKALNVGIARDRILIIDPKRCASPEGFGISLWAVCRLEEIDFIGQYGWMPLTPQNVIDTYASRMINQHPGPLDPGHPDFGGKGMYGRRVHAARLLFVRQTGRDFWTEATAQRVDAKFDRGAVIKTERVPIEPDDDVAALQQRVMAAEHRVQIAVLEDAADGRSPPAGGEMVREERLVRFGEEGILAECKQTAVWLFPRG